MMYGAVHWQVYAAADEIHDVHGRLKEFRTALELVSLVRLVVHTLNSAHPDGPLILYKDLATLWEQQVVQEVGPNVVILKQRLNWIDTLKQCEVWRKWCNRLGGPSKGQVYS
jgi:hypothetical protein